MMTEIHYFKEYRFAKRFYDKQVKIGVAASVAPIGTEYMVILKFPADTDTEARIEG